MKKSKFTILSVLAILMIAICTLVFTGCSRADTTRHNIQEKADKFQIYRKMTFVNLYTGELLYSAEGYFSIQTTYDNSYQGQQEIGLVFMVGPDQYKMDYFSIAENVCYVIEQTENTTTDPYHWDIVWYIAISNNIGG